MITFDDTAEMLESIAIELPKDFYRELNGGINLLPDTKLHPQSRDRPLYVLGEYTHDKLLGRFINIYHGSFMQLYEGLPADRFKEKLRDTLVHEFTHHLESLAGVDHLVKKDDEEILTYNMM